MVVEPVDNHVDGLVLDGLVEDLVHEAMPHVGGLVVGADGVLPVDIVVRRDEAVGLAVHDECRGLEVVCVDRVVDLGHAHLLDHARSKILVVQRIGHVVVNDGLVGAHTATERVLDVDGLRGCRDGGGGEVTTVLQGPRQELALVAGQSGQRNVLGLGQLGVALSLGQVCLLYTSPSPRD